MASFCVHHAEFHDGSADVEPERLETVHTESVWALILVALMYVRDILGHREAHAREILSQRDTHAHKWKTV